MVAPSYIGEEVRASNNAAGVALAPPVMDTAVTDGDVVFISMGVKKIATIVCDDPAWFEVYNVSHPTQAITLSLWAYMVTDTLEVPQPTFTWGSSASCFGQSWAVFRDRVNSSETAADAIGAVVTNTGSGNPHTNPGFVQTGDNSFLAYQGCGQSNTAYTTPSGWTERVDSGDTLSASRNCVGSRPGDGSGVATGSISMNSTTAAWVTGMVEILEPVAAPSDLTLSAAGGSFTHAGRAANIRHGWTLPAQTASFSVSTPTTGLRLSRTVRAAPASLSLAGGSAGLRLLRKMVAGAASFLATGGAVTLRRGGGAFEAQPGSYVLASPPAFLRRGFELPAQHGSFISTGVDVAFRRTRALPASPAPYSAVFQDAVLLRSRVFEADAGSFALSAPETKLGQFFRRVSAVGSFLLNPTETLLLVKRQLLADAGAFNLTGSAELVLTGPSFLTPPLARIYTPFFENRIISFPGENRIMLASKQLFSDRVIAP